MQILWQYTELFLQMTVHSGFFLQNVAVLEKFHPTATDSIVPLLQKKQESNPFLKERQKHHH
jgi:hypothetical protein